ncbi:hypothetical protein A7982_13980 [Minicystis rosea]|nr:hypothetical protein A7982_13980 [Minicystis rosea]
METCDGADLDGQSCQSLGYARGELRCGSSCAFDTRACTSCVPGGPIVACAAVEPSPTTIWATTLATSGDEVLVVWSERIASNGCNLFVRRYDASLVPRGAARCVGRANGNPMMAAPTRAGWVVAYDSLDDEHHPQQAPGLVVQALDPEGAPAGAAWRTGLGIYTVALRREGRGPLLVGADASGASLRALSVADDGRLEHAGPPHPLVGPGMLVLLQGLATPEGYLVAGHRMYLREMRGVVIARVGDDAVVRSIAQPFGDDGSFAGMAWLGQSVGVQIPAGRDESRAHIDWAEVRANGTVAAPRRTIVPEQHPDALGYGAMGRMVTAGQEVLQLTQIDTARRGPVKQTRVGLRRLGFDGRERADPLVVDRSPVATPLGEQSIARMDNGDVVVSWVRNGFPMGFFLARVKP